MGVFHKTTGLSFCLLVYLFSTDAAVLPPGGLHVVLRFLSKLSKTTKTLIFPNYIKMFYCFISLLV